MRYLIWLLAFSLTLPACAQKAKPRKTKAAMPFSKPAAQAPTTGPVLVVQRTPCNGTCPVYKAAIFADGRVEYEGERFVSLLGKHTLSLPATTVDQMLAEAQRIGFGKLRDRYAGNTADLPSTIITVHPVGQPAKSVYAMQDIPENLRGYLTYLNKQLDPLANSVQDK